MGRIALASCGVVLAALLATGAMANTIPTQNLNETTAALINQGRFSDARDLLVSAGATDSQKLLFQARIAKAQGHLGVCLSLLRQAQNKFPEDLDVLRELADSLVLTKQGNEARKVLMRLLLIETNPVLRQSYIARIAQIKKNQPLRFTAGIKAVPSTNINSGTFFESFDTVIGDLQVGEASKAQSGTGYNANGTIQYRWQHAAGRALTLTGQIDQLWYPSYRELDKRSVAGTLEWSHRWQHKTVRRWISLRDLKAEDGSDYRAFGFGAAFKRNRTKNSVLTLEVNTEARRYKTDKHKDGSVISAAIQVDKALTKDRLHGLRLSLEHTGTEAPHLAHNGVSLQYTLNQRFSTNLVGQFQAYFGQRTFLGPAPLSPHNREDQYYGVSAKVRLPKMQFLGYQPEFGCSAHRNRSNVDLYSHDITSCSIGLNVSF